MPRFRVTIQGQGYEAMADLVRKYQLDVVRHTARKHHKDEESKNEVEHENLYHVDAIVEEEMIDVLEKKGYKVIRYEDVDQHGCERQKEVGEGNRYLS